MHTEIKKLTRSIYLVAMVVIIAFLLVLLFLTRSFVSIKVNPGASTILIDGNKTIASNGLIRKFTTPGPHLVEVSRAGYIGISQKVNFGRGITKSLKITLKPTPKPLAISENAKFLNKGNDFSDAYFLSDTTFHKIIVKADSDQKVKVSEDRAISGPSIPEVDEVTWSPLKDLALLKTSDYVTLFDFKKYDFVNQTNEDWGQNVGSIAWSPDNSKIAYYYAPTTGEKSLIFSNITNKDFTRMLNFKDYDINDPILRWSPDSEWLLIIPRNDDPSGNKIYVFNAYSRELTEIADTGNQLDAMFSPDGNKIIYSTYSTDQEGPIDSVLSVMDKDGSNKKSLGIKANLSKITWSKDSQHIVVATYDYGTKKESLFRFNTETKEKDGFVITDLGDIFIHSLMLTDDNKVVIYQDNSGIYSINVN